MRRPVWRAWTWLALWGVVTAAGPLRAGDATDADPVPSALFDYVARPEPQFGWQLRDHKKLDTGQVYDLELTSQVWKGIVWKHSLLVFEPVELRYPQHVLLFVTGGSNGSRPGAETQLIGLKMAQLTGARVATLSQVPNQPLFDGRKEDDLISETWLRFIETGDTEWPLLFPMVKSAVKAMDAIEQLAAKEWQGKIDGFVITGASKRGWTSWLTPVADKRIIATAPMVIDVLNFRPQMKHQMETWGRFSEQIEDYTRKGLVKLGEETPRDTQLRQMMDPYTYRSRLSLPKLLINGTNDRYWVVDATRFYWDDLIGPKYLLAVPNAGHGLDGGRELALRTLAVFFQHAVTHTALPALDAHYSSENGTLRLKVASTPEPRAAQLWTATSDTKDFRGAKWSPHSMQQHEGSYLGEVERPAGGHAAVFGELQFEYQGVPYSLTTLVRWE